MSLKLKDMSFVCIQQDTDEIDDRAAVKYNRPDFP